MISGRQLSTNLCSNPIFPRVLLASNGQLARFICQYESSHTDENTKGNDKYDIYSWL